MRVRAGYYMGGILEKFIGFAMQKFCDVGIPNSQGSHNSGFIAARVQGCKHPIKEVS